MWLTLHTGMRENWYGCSQCVEGKPSMCQWMSGHMRRGFSSCQERVDTGSGVEWSLPLNRGTGGDLAVNTNSRYIPLQQHHRKFLHEVQLRHLKIHKVKHRKLISSLYWSQYTQRRTEASCPLATPWCYPRECCWSYYRPSLQNSVF
jgi:hypothetical protein